MLTQLLSTGSSPELAEGSRLTLSSRPMGSSQAAIGYALVWQESAGSQIFGLVRRFPGKIHIGSTEMSVSGQFLIETAGVFYR